MPARTVNAYNAVTTIHTAVKYEQNTYKCVSSCYRHISRFLYEIRRQVTENILNSIQLIQKFLTIQSETIFKYRFENMYVLKLQRKGDDFLD